MSVRVVCGKFSYDSTFNVFDIIIIIIYPRVIFHTLVQYILRLFELWCKFRDSSNNDKSLQFYMNLIWNYETTESVIRDPNSIRKPFTTLFALLPSPLGTVTSACIWISNAIQSIRVHSARYAMNIFEHAKHRAFG